MQVDIGRVVDELLLNPKMNDKGEQESYSPLGDFGITFNRWYGKGTFMLPKNRLLLKHGFRSIGYAHFAGPFDYSELNVEFAFFPVREKQYISLTGRAFYPRDVLDFQKVSNGVYVLPEYRTIPYSGVDDMIVTLMKHISHEIFNRSLLSGYQHTHIVEDLTFNAQLFQRNGLVISSDQGGYFRQPQENEVINVIAPTFL